MTNNDEISVKNVSSICHRLYYATDIVVSFLRDTNIQNVKRFPSVEDTSTVFPEEIVRKLDQPSYDRRGRFVFA